MDKEKQQPKNDTPILCYSYYNAIVKKNKSKKKKHFEGQDTTSFLLDPMLNQEFRDVAHELRMTRSEILREFVRRFVAENKGE